MHNKKCAHEHTGSAETLRPSLRNGLTTYTRSPWRPGFLVTIARTMREHHRELDANPGASGPHAFAVRRRAHRRVQPASTATCTDVSDEGLTSPLAGQDTEHMPQIITTEKQNIFSARYGRRGQIAGAWEGFAFVARIGPGFSR